MIVCVLNIGSDHSIYRTIALSEHCEIEKFIQIGPLNHHHKKLQKAGVEVVSLNYRGFSALKIARYLQLNTKADYYVCHYAYGMHVDACIYAKLKNIAVIAMGSDILYNDYPKPVLFKRKFVLNHVNYISSKSEEINSVLKQWKIRTAMSLNYWGVSEGNFYYIPESEAKKRMDVQPGKTIFLSSRTISRLYNIDLIAKAFIEINNRTDNAYFVFAGRIADHSYLSEIESLFNNHGLTNYKITGEIESEELNLYYNASEIVFSFADREGFPNSIFEVFACRANLICGEIETLVSFSKKTRAELNLCSFDHNSIVSKAMELISATDYSYERKSKNYLIFKQYGNLDENANKFYQSLLQTSGSGEVTIYTFIKLLIYDLIQIIYGKLHRIFTA